MLAQIEQAINAGGKLGTLEMQQFLAVLLVLLCLVVAYQTREARANYTSFVKHHESLVEAVQLEREAVTVERGARTTMLLEVVRDNTKAMTALTGIIERSHR